MARLALLITITAAAVGAFATEAPRNGTIRGRVEVRRIAPPV